MDRTGELFKRRRNHNNTPKYALLIITNYVVCCTLFTLDAKINWFFLLTIALLGVYNYFNIRRNVEEFTKLVIIAYVISWVGVFLLFFITRNQL
jgi:predicted membrane channel-forming protein YqfA (hemolysin III family)